MCSGFTHQHTVEETYPRSQTVKPSFPSPPPPPHPYLLPLCDSSFPFLSLNTLPFAKLQHSIFQFPFTPPHTHTHFDISPPLPSASPLSPPPPSSLLPGGFHHAQSFSIFNVFYLSTEERMCEQLPNKGKTPSCHLRKRCREEGGREGDRQGGHRELDNKGS